MKFSGQINVNSNSGNVAIDLVTATERHDIIKKMVAYKEFFGAEQCALVVTIKEGSKENTQAFFGGYEIVRYREDYGQFPRYNTAFLIQEKDMITFFNEHQEKECEVVIHEPTPII